MSTHGNSATPEIKEIIRPDRRLPIDVVIRPFQRFIEAEEAGGVTLIIFTAIALYWANSQFAGSYDALWATPLRIGTPGFNVELSLLHWVNDGLMAIFFFFVGLEIKREVLVGELSSIKNAALPIFAALGGMVVPAAIYVAFNAGGAGARGWGIPMATDIAFALGILALLGKRVPISLTVFLAALAIADDLGAVLVIAGFYTAEIHWSGLMLAIGFLGLLVLANRLGIRSPLVYASLGFVVWLGVHHSGIHATIAGVAIAMTIPTRTRIDSREFLDRGRRLLGTFETRGVEERDLIAADDQEAIVEALEVSCKHVQSPAHRLETALSPWIAFVIMPVFALANAGVAFTEGIGPAITHPVTFGVAAGLVFGKQIGIFLFSWIAVRFGIARLPTSVGWRQIYGAAWLGGIGFTMSLFIAGLAFSDVALLPMAKIGILSASTISAVVGALILRGGSIPDEGTSPSAVAS